MSKSKALAELENLIRRICNQVIREHSGLIQLGSAVKKIQNDDKTIKAFINDQEFINKDFEQRLSRLLIQNNKNENGEDVPEPEEADRVSPNQLIAFRTVRGLSQEVVAALLGVSVWNYGKWERGESIMTSAIEERFRQLEKMTGTELRKKMQELGFYEISGKRVKNPNKNKKSNKKKTVLVSIIAAAQITDLRLMLGKTVDEMNDLFDPKERRYAKWQNGKSRPPSATAKRLLDMYEKKLSSFEKRNTPASSSKSTRRYYESPKLPRAAIREGRKHLGLTCRQMAEILGVPYTTYRNWECGNSRPSPEMIEKMLVMFGNPPTKSVYAAARHHVVTIASKEDYISDRIPGKELRELRLRMKLTRRQMAKLLNVSYSRYQNWENKGRYVPSEYVSRIRMLQKMSDKDIKKRIALLKSSEPLVNNKQKHKRNPK
jgi:DNA-binding transcriptional regulator YiaG